MSSGAEARAGRASALVALGSNLGDRRANIGRALESIGRRAGCEVGAVSSLMETEPVGGPPQPRYLNGAAEVLTSLGPADLLRCLHEIEAALGRVRSIPNAPREIDLDLLLYDDLVLDEPGIRIPHPRMLERRFVLAPLAEIAPGRRHPITLRTIEAHLEELEKHGELEAEEGRKGAP
jgi:2-amino-4-hydroxy-6-hydroxymethyldihydropteridine diphosphokinase